MKSGMAICVAAVLVAAGLALAGPGWSSKHSLADGNVTVSNGQANSSWVPVAVLVQFDSATSGTATVRRVSQGMDVILDQLAFANASSVVWVAAAAFPFGQGDALVVTSSATNGNVQVLRRGE